jgi:anti-anti-sigma factor
MFSVTLNADNTIYLTGRLDASQADVAKKEFNKIERSATVDFSGLDYISSAGLGVLLMTQKRLMEKGHKLKLVNLNSHVREVFKYARFDYIFDIE